MNVSNRKRSFLAATAVLALGAGAVTLGQTGGQPLSTPAFALDAAPSQALNNRPGFAAIVKRVNPAVVAVQVAVQQAVDADQTGPGPGPGMPNVSPDDPLYQFFRQFQNRQGNQGNQGFNGNPHPQMRKGMAQGSGFFISPDGLLVTNNHVVENGVTFQVKMDDGVVLPATLVGRDPKTDLAVLRVKGDRPFPFVKFARGESEVGDWVIAVGNPFGLGGTVTAGILSARGRDIGSGPYDDYLQIDAPVNRGNSGGPTFNTDGEVIGVNTAIYSPSGGSVGIGFAIPAATVEKVVGQLSKSGSVTRGWLGIQMQGLTPDLAKSLGVEKTEGVLVAEPQEGSPALKAGIRSGDVIVGVNGEPVSGTHVMARIVADLAPGSSAKFDVLRDGDHRMVNVTIGDYPGEKVASRDPQSDNEAADASKLGLGLLPSPDGRGVLVSQLDPDGLAASKGVQQGDVILDLGGKGVNRPDDVKRGLSAAKADGKAFVLARVKNQQGVRFVALPLTKAG